jgi:hypothetical protein
MGSRRHGKGRASRRLKLKKLNWFNKEVNSPPKCSRKREQLVISKIFFVQAS